MRILSLIAALGVVAFAADASPATVIDSKDPVAAGLGNYLSARYAAVNHDYAEAARLYKASADSDPANVQLLTRAFLYSANAGEMDDAVRYAGQLTALTPDDFVARLTLAVAAMKKHDFARARSEIGKIAKVPFTNNTVTLVDGWAAAGMGDGGAARDAFKPLHAQRGGDGLAYFNEAMLAELLGDKQGAEANYRLAIAAAGQMPRVADALGRFLERNGRAAEAREMYQKLATEPGFAQVAEPGLKRIAAGTVPDAFAPGAEIAAAEALFGLAAAFNDEAGRDISVLYLRLALHLNPKLDIATILLANRLEALGRFEDAIVVYRTMAPDSPFYRAAAVASAVDLTRLDRPKEAIERFEQLTKEQPDDVESWTGLGDALRITKRYAEAVRAYDRALEVPSPTAKKNWALLFYRAMAEQETGNWAKAEADLKEALVYSPNEPAVLNFLGYSWVDQQKNVKEALTMLEKARALSPQNGYIIDSVGWAYYRLGRYNDAVDTLEDAVELVPSDATINDHLGDAYWKVGRSLDAKFQWSHALAFGPEAGEKAEIEKKLKSAGE